MVIGLTGQIGSGKSAAAKILAEFGALVIDADQIGREVVENSKSLKTRLAKAFGNDILTPAGNIRRKELARRAFADPACRRRLNRLVHPFLLRELKAQLRKAKKSFELVVIDAALLPEWNLERELDYILVIHASREIRMNRMAKRGISRTDALARERMQLSYREFSAMADRVILNNSTLRKFRDKLKQQIRQWGYHID